MHEHLLGHLTGRHADHHQLLGRDVDELHVQRHHDGGLDGDSGDPVTLYVVPNPQTIVYGSAVPGSSFYTFTYHTGSATGPVVTPTVTTAPVCTSTYSATSPAGTPITINCSGGTSTNYTFNDTTTAVLTVTKATLYVVPNAQTIVAGSAAPGSSFYTFTYHTGSATGPVVTPTVTTAPVCTSTYSATSPAGTPITITCSGGTSTNYTFNDTATAVLTVTPAVKGTTGLAALPAEPVPGRRWFERDLRRVRPGDVR